MLVNRQPKQARSRETYDRLLSMAQEILEEEGIEGLTSNALVEHLGLTPPAFYRYFPNKYALLGELGQRLMDAQNQTLIDMEPTFPMTYTSIIEDSQDLLKTTLESTRAFKGGYALMVSLRAIPEVRHVRLDSHGAMARLVAKRLKENEPLGRPRSHAAKSRLVIEIGYGTIEMLFETGFENERYVIEGAARAMAAVLEV